MTELHVKPFDAERDAKRCDECEGRGYNLRVDDDGRYESDICHVCLGLRTRELCDYCREDCTHFAITNEMTATREIVHPGDPRMRALVCASEGCFAVLSERIRKRYQINQILEASL